jgi:hypothetical protein
VVEDAAELGRTLVQGRGARGVTTLDGGSVDDHHPSASVIIEGLARVHLATGSDK